nr:retrovirus-related Pol polyprotein from transposon TNT 1-94 [Tanacetum cinerariifolium]
GSYHIKPRLDLFFDFLKCDGNSVLLGDNIECKIRGIGKLETIEKEGYTVKLQSGKIKTGTYQRGVNKDVGEAGSVWQEEYRFKHKAFEKSKEWKQLVRNRTGRTVKKLRTDKHQNWLAKRMNRTLIDKNNTRELVDHLAGQKLVSCKWLFKIKKGIEGVQKHRYKARFVVRGFTQRASINYNEVFLLVVRHTSIRVILALIAYKDYELEQLDIKRTFLHENHEEVIYMRQPPGYEQGNKSIKSLLKRKFDMKDLEEAKKILGIDIIRDRCRKIMRVSQSWDYDVERISKVPHANEIESLMYLMVCMRPDIAYARGGGGDGLLNWMSSGDISERVRVMFMGPLPCVGGGGGTPGGGEIVDGVFDGAFSALSDESWFLGDEVEALVDFIDVVEVEDE